jgi:hypothetical protein
MVCMSHLYALLCVAAGQECWIGAPAVDWGAAKDGGVRPGCWHLFLLAYIVVAAVPGGVPEVHACLQSSGVQRLVLHVKAAMRAAGI